MKMPRQSRSEAFEPYVRAAPARLCELRGYAPALWSAAGQIHHCRGELGLTVASRAPRSVTAYNREGEMHHRNSKTNRASKQALVARPSLKGADNGAHRICI